MLSLHTLTPHVCLTLHPHTSPDPSFHTYVDFLVSFTPHPQSFLSVFIPHSQICGYSRTFTPILDAEIYIVMRCLSLIHTSFTLFSFHTPTPHLCPSHLAYASPYARSHLSTPPHLSHMLSTLTSLTCDDPSHLSCLTKTLFKIQFTHVFTKEIEETWSENVLLCI